MTETGDILDAAVTRIAHDDYNHIPEATLRERLEAIRQTRVEERLEEWADTFTAQVREALSGWDPTDPEYGE